MIELTCYDSNGNTISNLTQWDLNRVIYIENPEFSKSPLALFSNNNTNSYLVATELTEDNKKIKITVPNLLLQQNKTIIMGLCSFDMINNINNTKYILKLPVYKLAMPTNYVFTDNAVDLNWLRNILGDYINKGIADIDTTAQAQAESLENLTEVSISKLGYYTNTADIVILQESESIDVTNYNTFVLTDDGELSQENFYIQIHQYDTAGQLISTSNSIAVGQTIDISAASYITLLGTGTSGTFTVTYRISKDIDIVHSIGQLSDEFSRLASNSVFGRDFSSNAAFASTFAINNMFGSGFASNAAFANTFANNNTFASAFASNSTFGNAFASNTAFANTFASNSTFGNTFAYNTAFANTFASNSTFASTFASNSTFASTFASNSTFASTFASNTTFANCLASNYTFVDRLLYTLPQITNQTVVPAPTEEDKGKILAVTSSGSLSWITP